MKDCDITRDLMPLYAEELVSPGSREFLEAHLESCGECRAFWQRNLTAMPELEAQEDYKAPLKQGIAKIVLQTVAAVLTGLILMGYLMWEFGYFGEVKRMEAPDGGSNFQVKYYNEDGFFVTGGAYVVLPQGTGRDLRGDQTFVDLDVYWAPDSEAFFAVWQFTDHREVYYVDYRDVEEAGGWRNYLENRDLYSENFYEELAGECGIMTEQIEFVRWSEDSRSMIFQYTDTQGRMGMVTYSLAEKSVVVVELS